VEHIGAAKVPPSRSTLRHGDVPWSIMASYTQPLCPPPRHGDGSEAIMADSIHVVLCESLDCRLVRKEEVTMNVEM